MNEHDDDFDSYRRKSKRVFYKAYTLIAEMGADDDTVEIMKPSIRRSFDKEFDCEAFDYKEASNRFIAKLYFILGCHDIRKDKQQYICENVLDALEYDFDTGDE